MSLQEYRDFIASRATTSADRAGEGWGLVMGWLHWPERKLLELHQSPLHLLDADISRSFHQVLGLVHQEPQRMPLEGSCAHRQFEGFQALEHQSSMMLQHLPTSISE